MDRTPHKLAEERLELSALYQTLSDEYADILRFKPAKWILIRQNVKSDMQAEREWQRSAEGNREQIIKIQLKALEKKMSGIRSYLDVLNGEARNMY